MLKIEREVAGIKISFDPIIDLADAHTVDAHGEYLNTICPSGRQEGWGGVDEVETESREIAKRFDVPILRINRSLLKQAIDAKKA